METIQLTIDGRTVTGRAGQTILAIAAENGIEIPNLCYDKSLKIYGACGLCVVEAENSPKLLRACATKASDGMVVRTDTPRALQARKVALELLLSDHEGDCKGPCALRCPAHTEVQAYIKQIALGNDREAVAIIKEKIPLPASIGRVCPHPCEADCRRGLVEQPLSIAYLKAFAADRDLASGDPFRPTCQPDTGKRVAVVGGGPAGLSAAYYLRLAGHRVTVLDAMPEMGGMLRYGIPEYRLPKRVLAREIEEIRQTGVELVNGVRLGRDMSLEDLRKEYDAVLLAVGAWRSRGVGCPGENLTGVLGGIDFLRAVNLGESVSIGKRVAVVGGGNTAMDACRTAVRCGAERVYVVYRRTRAEAPAEDLEISEAIEEGVEFKFLTNPAQVLGENGHVIGLKLQVMALGEPDASGRRRPVPMENTFELLEVDTVIAAIGQDCDPAGLSQVSLSRKGTVEADETTCATNLEGVFAAGDATNRGASIAIEAIAEGDRAAAAVDAWLTGKPMNFPEPYYSKKEVTAEMLADREKKPREAMGVRAPDVRRRDFDSVIQGFSEAQARREAARCLECGCHDYQDCRLIYFANQRPIQPERFAGEKHPGFKEQALVSIERDQGKCVLCALCVRACREQAGKGLLGLVGRGFPTVIRPEFQDSEAVRDCAGCHLCADLCPTGALKILGKR
ncbi:MAG: FAD-dependent oxidoreductase [Oscillospiraceae bacterium]|nr:FAD-dependent oxidoreductase [Oscillospiraceae bacterium]